MNKMLEKNFEVFDISPFFRKPVKGRGFSIKISRSSGEEPRVSVSTFGDVNRGEIEKSIKKIGFREDPKIRETEGPGKPGVTEREEGKVCISGAKTTEEPKTCVKRIGERMVVEVELPDVRDSRDIEVKSLENSIELKALAGDRAYFKILTKPPQTNVKEKRFKRGILYLELG